MKENKNLLYEKETRSEVVEKIAAKWRKNSDNKEYYFPLPDNTEAFYAYVNLIINNRDNSHKPDNYTTRPKNFGPVKDFNTHRNEVGEKFIVVYNLKDYRFLEMLVNQFALIRTYFNWIEDAVEYPNSSKYEAN